MHTECVFDGLQQAGGSIPKWHRRQPQTWALYTMIRSSLWGAVPASIQYQNSCKVCKGLCHTDTDQMLKTHAHTCTHYANSCPVSVITKLCGGYNGGMLSFVKSCGQSETTQGHLCFCVSPLREIPRCQPNTPLQKHTDQIKHEMQRMLWNNAPEHKGSLCARCSSAQIMVINFVRQSRISTHCCLNRNCSSLFLPHPHLSVR